MQILLLLLNCNSSSLIISLMVRIILYTSSKRFFQKLNRVLDGKVVLMTKSKYGSVVYFLYSLLKSSNSMSDKLFLKTNWSSSLFEIFIMKMRVVFNPTSIGAWKYDCVMKIKDIFNFLPLINSSVTSGWSFLLLIMSTIVWANAINTFCYFPRLYFSILQ